MKKILDDYIKDNFSKYDVKDLIKKATKLNKDLYSSKYNNNLFCLAILKQIKELESKADNNYFIDMLIYHLIREPLFNVESDLKNTALAIFIDTHIDLTDEVDYFVFYEKYSGSYIIIDLYLDLLIIYGTDKVADISSMVNSIDIITFDELTKEKLSKYLIKYEIDIINSKYEADDLLEILTGGDSK